MRRTSRWSALGILVLALVCLWIVWPQRPTNYLPDILPWPQNPGLHLNLFGLRFDRQGMLLGIDLGGGTHLVFQADMSQVEATRRREALDGLKLIIERRVNALGLTNPEIQTKGQDRISVILPGIRDVEEAKRLIGDTAKLEFKELKAQDQGEPQWVPAAAKLRDGTEKVLTGEYLRPNSIPRSDPSTGLPEVAFEWNDDGTVLFEQITRRLVGKPLGIFLDGQLISSPVVRSVISRQGVITGLDRAEAQRLAIQLNSGALPVPVTVIQERSVDAVLGADSVRKSVIAGRIGLGIVLLFMLLNYRLPGLLAGAALLVYSLLVLAIFKLLPVELNLPSIAAFVLSIGMAVDANILIFERMKEELRAGRTLGAAIEAGFDRAWAAIRDSNVSTLITCLILFWFGSQFGTSQVVGFAVTLAIGVMISMFSAITITRNFLRLLIGTGAGERQGLFAA